MLKFGDVFQNILTLLVLMGFAYLIYSKWKGKNVKFRGLFTKAEEVVNRMNIKGEGGKFGK